MKKSNKTNFAPEGATFLPCFFSQKSEANAPDGAFQY